jgi:predicted dehydrogenase
MPGPKLGVGIIGVNPAWGWAATAHIPALRALPNYEVTALSASSLDAARAAGEALGVAAVFAHHDELLAQTDVDLVAVTVKVPHHRELVSAALAAGKAVYCEWPLGRDLDDARAMAALAAEREPRTVVGLQARQAPAVEFVRELLRDGYVGEVLSTSMYVGRAYAAFAADIESGTHSVPDFADAVRRHEVIAAIERAAASGERVKL